MIDGCKCNKEDCQLSTKHQLKRPQTVANYEEETAACLKNLLKPQHLEFPCQMLCFQVDRLPQWHNQAAHEIQ